MVANLMAGGATFVKFALRCGAIDNTRAMELYALLEAALMETAGTQADLIGATEVAATFIRLLRSALASGAAHLASDTGRAPESALEWGWRPQASGTSVLQDEELRPMGARIGWVDETGVFLDMDAALRAANQVAGDGGDRIAVSQRELAKRMMERGLVVSRDGDAGRSTKRIWTEGKLHRALHLRPEAIRGHHAGRAGGPAQPALDLGE